MFITQLKDGLKNTSHETAANHKVAKVRSLKKITFFRLWEKEHLHTFTFSVFPPLSTYPWKYSSSRFFFQRTKYVYESPKSWNYFYWSLNSVCGNCFAYFVPKASVLGSSILVKRLMKENFLLGDELQWEMEYVFGNGAIWAFVDIIFY